VLFVTLRDNTERPETVEVGANMLAGADALRPLRRPRMMMGRENQWQNPFWEGRAKEKIVEHLTAGQRCSFGPYDRTGALKSTKEPKSFESLEASGIVFPRGEKL
jgi:hypothetical protein